MLDAVPMSGTFPIPLGLPAPLLVQVTIELVRTTSEGLASSGNVQERAREVDKIILVGMDKSVGAASAVREEY